MYTHIYIMSLCILCMCMCKVGIKLNVVSLNFVELRVQYVEAFVLFMPLLRSPLGRARTSQHTSSM